MKIFFLRILILINIGFAGILNASAASAKKPELSEMDEYKLVNLGLEESPKRFADMLAGIQRSHSEIKDSVDAIKMALNSATKETDREDRAKGMLLAALKRKDQMVINFLKSQMINLKLNKPGQHKTFLWQYKTFLWKLITEYMNDDNIDFLEWALNLDASEINEQGYLGQTVLFFALDKPKMVEILLRHGADVFINDAYGKTPLDYALQSLGLDDPVTRQLQEATAKQKASEQQALQAFVDDRGCTTRNTKFATEVHALLGI